MRCVGTVVRTRRVHKWRSGLKKNMVLASKSKNLHRRAEIIQLIRLFFIEQGYLEVDTPLRLPALIPEANIEPETSGDYFLQTSPELCMKRLLSAGHDKIFQICKCFRKHERGARHLPEFTMLEWYRLDSGYQDLMSDCQDLFAFLADKLDFADLSAFLKETAENWQYLPVAKAFERYTSLSAGQALQQDKFDELLVTEIEPKLGRKSPTFLFDYPAELGSLARLKTSDSSVAERFELYIDGIELANGFSELTDAGEQRQRFAKERELCHSQGREPGAMPEKFLVDLEHLDKAAGIALGIDRLVMLFCGAEQIDDVVAFTTEQL